MGPVFPVGEAGLTARLGYNQEVRWVLWLQKYQSGVQRPRLEEM